MVSMFRGKRGIFFTIIAISLLGIILFSYSVTYSYSLQEKASVVETRVNTMQNFMDSIDSDMENAVYISGYRSLVGLTDYLTTNATYVNDSEDALEELLLNGTVDGFNSSLMVNNTLPYWMQKMSDKGLEIGINLSISLDSVSIYHVSPWIVRFSVSAEVNLSDYKATANWSQEKDIYSDVSILGFEDPWYPLHTNGMISKRVNASIYDGNFTGTYGDATDNFRDHVANTLYISFNASPSFLMRFENDMNASTYGIESIVNKTEVLDYCSQTTSSVDHFCWRRNSTPTVWRVQDMNDTKVRMDNETNDAGIGRVARYDLEDVIY